MNNWQRWASCRRPDFRHSEPNSPKSLLFGKTITEIPEKVKAANPETYIRLGAPPFLLQHGTNDVTVPAMQSIDLVAKLEQVLGKDNVTLELLEGAEHADPGFETIENVNKVLDFLDRVLK